MSKAILSGVAALVVAIGLSAMVPSKSAEAVPSKAAPAECGKVLALGSSSHC